MSVLPVGEAISRWAMVQKYPLTTVLLQLWKEHESGMSGSTPAMLLIKMDALRGAPTKAFPEGIPSFLD